MSIAALTRSGARLTATQDGGMRFGGPWPQDALRLRPPLREQSNRSNMRSLDPTAQVLSTFVRR